jgi:hypothetical protein
LSTSGLPAAQLLYAAASLDCMPNELPDSCLRLLEFQQGTIARWQAQAAGLDARTMEARLRRQRWQPVYRGVYAAFTGEPARESMLWAAVLRAGPGAALSHHTAAELERLADGPADPVHVTVGAGRQLAVSGRERHPRARAWSSTGRHESLPPGIRSGARPGPESRRPHLTWPSSPETLMRPCRG